MAVSYRREGMHPIVRVPETGTYSLIVFISDEVRAKVGRLGENVFRRGYYTLQARPLERVELV